MPTKCGGGQGNTGTTVKPVYLQNSTNASELWAIVDICDVCNCCGKRTLEVVNLVKVSGCAVHLPSEAHLSARQASRRWDTDVEGALIGSLVSHEDIQVVHTVVLLSDPQRQHLLVQEQAAQALLAGLTLLLQLPLAHGFLLQLPLLGALL